MNHRKYRLTNQNGFTLMEVLIAMTIFGVALLGLAQLQIASIQGNRFSYDVTEASAIATNALEHLTSMSASNPGGLLCPATEQIVRSGLTFTRICQLAVAEIGQRTAVVTVQWSDKNGTARTVAMRTLI